jgi:hypothetical protein
MAKASNVIRIPKTPTTAFNKDRPVSDLLWEQVEHVAAVVRRMIDEERRAVRTEGEASAFIKKYTEFLLGPDAIKKPTPVSKGSRKRTTASKGGRKKTPRSSKR